MTMTTRLLAARWLAALIACAGLAATAADAFAQAWPSRPLRLIVPYPPGGNTDIVARLYGQKLAERLAQPVVFDNRGGAAGTLGMGLAAKAPNDGYTLTIGDLGTLAVAGFANPGIAYQPQRDFAPLGLVASVSVVVTASLKSPFNTIDDLLAHARAHPGRVTYATSGIGSPNHMAFELLRSMTGVNLLHVPYKGGAPAVTALIGGEVDVVVDGAAFAQLKGGRLKALAVTGPRLPALPDVPSIGESVKGFEFTNWWGFLAPAGTPAEAIRRVNEELAAIAGTAEVRERLAGLGLAARSTSPQQFAEHIRTETEKIGRIVREAGIKFD